MGGLSTHVLDTAHGKPGQGIPVTLFRIKGDLGDGDRVQVCATRTNIDGRTDAPLLSGDDFEPGTYELVFTVAEYFSSHPDDSETAAFLDEITLRFNISEDSHYHVPLLVSPWSYSTYRGS